LSLDRPRVRGPARLSAMSPEGKSGISPEDSTR